MRRFSSNAKTAAFSPRRHAASTSFIASVDLPVPAGPVSSVLLVCLRLHRAASRGEAVRRDMAVLGLLMGLSVWIHPIALYVGVPACAWLFVQRPRLLRDAWLAVPTGLLGVLPWLWANVRGDWGSLEQPTGSLDSSFWSRLQGFFEALLPRLAGLRDQYLGDWYLRPLSGIVYAALMIAALVAVRRWKGERTLLLTVAVAYPFLFAVPRNSVFVDEPRYGMALLPVLALCVGYGIERLARREVLAVGLIGVLSIVSITSLRHVVVESASRTGLDVLRPVDTDELWPVLREEGITEAYADYWIGMKLQFEQREPFHLLPINSYYLDFRYDAPAEGSTWAIFREGSPLVDRWTSFAAARGTTFTIRATEHFVLVQTAAPVPFAETLGIFELAGS